VKEERKHPQLQTEEEHGHTQGSVKENVDAQRSKEIHKLQRK
jgi:hypothetical protein